MDWPLPLKLFAHASALCGLVALMSIRDFDPGGTRGSWFGMVIVLNWVGALLLWALGSVRRNRSLGPRTIVFAFIALAITFGACPWLPVPYSIHLGFAAISVVMLYEACLRSASWAKAATFVMASGGLLGLALVIHAWLYMFHVLHY